MADHNDEQEQIYRDFKKAVNLSPSQMEKHLATPASQEVGWKGDDGHGEGESVGHESGRRIVEILRKKKDELSPDDFAHMKKVVGYVHRHLAQRPEGDVSDTHWRTSLMNWGHDPLGDE